MSLLLYVTGNGTKLSKTNLVYYRLVILHFLPCSVTTHPPLMANLPHNILKSIFSFFAEIQRASEADLVVVAASSSGLLGVHTGETTGGVVSARHTIRSPGQRGTSPNSFLHVKFKLHLHLWTPQTEINLEVWVCEKMCVVTSRGGSHDRQHPAALWGL